MNNAVPFWLPESALGPIRRYRLVIVVLVQLTLVVVSNYLGWLLRYDFQLPAWAPAAINQTLPVLVAVRAVTFVPFRLYQGMWRYTSAYDIGALLGGIGVSSATFFLIVWGAYGLDAYPRSVFIIDAVLLTMLMGGSRMARRMHLEVSQRATLRRRVLVCGAGDAGAMIVGEMRRDSSAGYHPVGFVDDDPSKLGQRIHGIRVLGALRDLQRIVSESRPDEILLAMPSADAVRMRALVRQFEPFSLPIKTLPRLRDIVGGTVRVDQVRNLAVEDLLSRPQVGLDERPLSELLRGRRVMVTGAGGSIGSELCRQILRFGPATLLLFERYENSLHNIRLELEDRETRTTIVAIIGDVAEEVSVHGALAAHRPEIVFHAAAHKHVPLMEENPREAIKNNVRGTRIMSGAAVAHAVSKFILISTDKAVNPSNVMGASKRLAETVVQLQHGNGKTDFAIVRFGNVLGSNGSVVPRFLEQIRRREAVTVTHPDVKRFFMLIPEAVSLVLHAAAHAEGGATYVLEMGEQLPVVEVARNLIRLSGLVPDEDVAIKFIGLRPGEKLEEELISADEDLVPSSMPQVMRVIKRSPIDPVLVEAIPVLEGLAAAGTPEELVSHLRATVYGVASAPTERT